MLRFCFLLAVFVCCYAPAHAGYDKPYIGEQVVYRTAYEDTFVHLARDYNLGFVEMRAANPDVDPWLPGKNTKLILPLRHILPDAGNDGIVINLPEMRLYAFVNGDNAPTTYPIGVGRDGLDTPEGTTTITRKKAGPTWTPTPRMRKEDPELKPFYPPGPENPLGTHALYLGWPTYALHGTNRPFGIGRRISSGCIRLYPESIERLFDVVPVGTKVQVVNQPIKLAWIDDELFIEAHPELEQALQMEEVGIVSSPKLSEDDLKRIIKAAGAFEERLDWKVIRRAVNERKGYPIKIAARPKNVDQSADENAALEDRAQEKTPEIDPDVKAIQDELIGALVAEEDTPLEGPDVEVSAAPEGDDQKSAGKKRALNP